MSEWGEHGRMEGQQATGTGRETEEGVAGAGTGGGGGKRRDQYIPQQAMTCKWDTMVNGQRL